MSKENNKALNKLITDLESVQEDIIKLYKEGIDIETSEYDHSAIHIIINDGMKEIADSLNRTIRSGKVQYHGVVFEQNNFYDT